MKTLRDMTKDELLRDKQDCEFEAQQHEDQARRLCQQERVRGMTILQQSTHLKLAQGLRQYAAEIGAHGWSCCKNTMQVAA